jgi:hypothetical protein
MKKTSPFQPMRGASGSSSVVAIMRGTVAAGKNFCFAGVVGAAMLAA